MTFGEGVGSGRVLVALYNDIASGNYGAAILTIVALIAFLLLMLGVGYLLRPLVMFIEKVRISIWRQFWSLKKK